MFGSSAHDLGSNEVGGTNLRQPNVAGKGDKIKLDLTEIGKP